MALHEPPATGVADGDERALRTRLGTRLRSRRKERGLTMVVLAHRAQCSQSLLSKVESGVLLPSLPMLQRLSRALESEISYFLET